MGATGLLQEVSEPAFIFSALLVQKLLWLFDAPNKLLQAEDMDLLIGLELVATAAEHMNKLHCEAEFTKLWNRANEAQTAQNGDV